MYFQSGFRIILRRAAVAVLLVGLGLPVVVSAQAERASGGNVAVIDVQRLLSESAAGQDALKMLRASRDQKQAEIEAKQGEIADLRARLAEGRLSLSEARIAELNKELEDKVIAFGRFQDDADRELQKSRDTAFADLEKRIMPIIDQAGGDLGYTMIFNKYQSGLLFVDEAMDITDVILERYNVTYQGEG